MHEMDEDIYDRHNLKHEYVTNRGNCKHDRHYNDCLPPSFVLQGQRGRGGGSSDTDE